MNNVYVVMGGWDYEGCDAESVEIFSTRDEADEYGESLVTVGGFHYFRVMVREVPSLGT